MKRILTSAIVLAGLAAAPAHAALAVGAKAPDFAVKAAQAGKEFDFSLADALKKGPVVLYFFPAAFTPRMHRGGRTNSPRRRTASRRWVPR